MPQNRPTLNEELSLAGIFGPGSTELERQEKYFVRYFEKEYRSALQNPKSLNMLGVATDCGPIAEETDSLMIRHYNERLEFFTSFLDKRYRAYSMAYYGDTPSDIRASTASLEEAQQAKFVLIASRAQIKGQERIVNIGCGFGSLETFLLQTFPDIEIVGITPSSLQSNYLRQRMQDSTDPLGSGRFSLIEGSFDKLPLSALGEKRYDLAISIGVFEQFLNMDATLERIASLLVPGGKTFHHFITSQQPVSRLLNAQNTRLAQYFPGGRIWPHDELAKHQQHFDLINSWFLNGLNYWRTLRDWHQRYWNCVPDLYGEIFDTEAIKFWNEYFILSKAMFAPLDGQFYGNSHYLFRLKG